MAASIGGYSGGGGFEGGSSGTTTTLVVGGTGLLFLPPLLKIAFRQKYLRWWLTGISSCCASPTGLGSHGIHRRTAAVRLDFGYPDAQNDLNRWLPMVKWFLATPHFRSALGVRLRSHPDLSSC